MSIVLGLLDTPSYRRRRGILPPSLNLGNRRWSVVNFTFRPLFYQGKNSLYLLDWGLGGPRTQSGRFGEERSLLLQPEFEHRIV
jgi:hypothetical protein